MTKRAGLGLSIAALGTLSTSCSTAEVPRGRSGSAIGPFWARTLQVPAQDLALWRGMLVVLRRGGDPARPLLWLYETSTGRFVTAFGREGVGSDEFLGAGTLTVDSLTGRLWVLDLTRRRWIGFNYMDGEARRSQIIQFSDTNTVLDAVWWRRSIITSGFYLLGQFAVFDSLGNLERYVGAPVDLHRHDGLVVVGPDGIPVDLEFLYDYDEAEVAFHSNRARIAVASDSAVVLARFLRPWLDFYDFAGRHRHTSHKVTVAANEVGVAKDPSGRTHVIPTRLTRYEYLDLAIGPSHVFGLYSGHSEASDSADVAYGSQVHVFSRQGEYEGSALLDRGLAAIEVDEPRGLLYGIGPSKGAESVLYRFSLPDVLRWAHANKATAKAAGARMGHSTVPNE